MSKRTRRRAGHRNPTAEKNRRRERLTLVPAVRIRDGVLYWARRVRKGELITMSAAEFSGIQERPRPGRRRTRCARA